MILEFFRNIWHFVNGFPCICRIRYAERKYKLKGLYKSISKIKPYFFNHLLYLSIINKFFIGVEKVLKIFVIPMVLISK